MEDDADRQKIIRWLANPTQRARLLEGYRLYLALNPPFLDGYSREQRTTPPRSVKQQVYDRQGGKCYYCEKPLPPPGTPKLTVRESASLDHMIPQARGGSSGIENLCYACDTCNKDKGTQTPEEFMRYGARTGKLIAMIHWWQKIAPDLLGELK